MPYYLVVALVVTRRLVTERLAEIASQGNVAIDATAGSYSDSALPASPDGHYARTLPIPGRAP